MAIVNSSAMMLASCFIRNVQSRGNLLSKEIVYCLLIFFTRRVHNLSVASSRHMFMFLFIMLILFDLFLLCCMTMYKNMFLVFGRVSQAQVECAHALAGYIK